LDNSKDIPPYHFLESLRNATLQVQGTNLEAELSQTIVCVSEKGEFHEGIMSVFYTAVNVGLLDYVSWVLDHDFAASDNTARLRRVWSVVMEKIILDDDTTGALPILVRFLKQGRLLDDETELYWNASGNTGYSFTVWEQCMIAATMRVHGMCEAQRVAFGEIFEILLKAGLRSSYYVTLDRDEDREDLMLSRGTSNGGWYFSTAGVSTFPRHLFEDDKRYSLTEVFDRLPLDNTETLKRYISKNITREHAGAANNGITTLDTDSDDGSQAAEPDSPRISGLESLPELEPEPESDPINTAETDSHPAVEHSEVALSSPVTSGVPTPSNHRWDLVTCHDLTSWYPLITFALGRCSPNSVEKI
jgi:hypothetical protein